MFSQPGLTGSPFHSGMNSSGTGASSGMSPLSGSLDFGLGSGFDSGLEVGGSLISGKRPAVWPGAVGRWATLVGSPGLGLPTPPLSLFRGALDFAAEQAQRVIAAHPGYAPLYTVGGRWNRESEHWTHWCEGFYPGIFWLLHRYTGDPEWRRHAETWTRPL